ncbi:MAG: YcxB family protein, partial [Chthoniobacterales bacterium]
HAEPSRWILSVSIALIYGVILYFLYPWRLRRYYKKTLPETMSPYFGIEVVFSFSDAGIDLTYSLGSSNYVWSAILRLEQTEEHIYLFTANAKALILSKKRLTSSVPVDELYGALIQLKNQNSQVIS